MRKRKKIDLMTDTNILSRVSLVNYQQIPLPIIYGFTYPSVKLLIYFDINSLPSIV